MRTATIKPRRAFVAVSWLLLLLSIGLVTGAWKQKKPDAVIFGTAYGPDDRPLYGVKVSIHPAGKKKPHWELTSDHHGEFAQRVPQGPGDYEISASAQSIPEEGGKPQAAKNKRLTGQTKVHVDGQERKDFSLHLTE